MHRLPVPSGTPAAVTERPLPGFLHHRLPDLLLMRKTVMRHWDPSLTRGTQGQQPLLVRRQVHLKVNFPASCWCP